VQELPGTLRQTTSTLGRVERFAKVLGPSLENLRPAVRALGPSQRALRPFAREAAPILEKRVRPFVRETRPLVRDLRPAARDLATSSPDLTRSVRVLNNLFNMAAFNPGGRQGPDVSGRNEGFLFSLAWLAHQSSNLFSTADAHGPFRPSLVSGSCSTFRSLVNDQPEQEFLMNLTPLLTDPALCGGEGASPVKRGQADKKRRKRAGR